MNLTIVKAELNKASEYYGSMDAYVEVEYLGVVKKTPVMIKVGKTPEWRFTFHPILISKIDEEIKFTVLEKDSIRSDTIGVASVRVRDLCSKVPKKRWLSLIKPQRKEDAGSLLIESMYISPDGESIP